MRFYVLFKHTFHTLQSTQDLLQSYDFNVITCNIAVLTQMQTQRIWFPLTHVASNFIKVQKCKDYCKGPNTRLIFKYYVVSYVCLIDFEQIVKITILLLNKYKIYIFNIK